MQPESLFYFYKMFFFLEIRLIILISFPLIVRTAAHLEDFTHLVDWKLGFNLLNEPVDQL
jgi:hypothetical protein